jgi:hypothetical protein
MKNTNPCKVRRYGDRASGKTIVLDNVKGRPWLILTASYRRRDLGHAVMDMESRKPKHVSGNNGISCLSCTVNILLFLAHFASHEINHESRQSSKSLSSQTARPGPVNIPPNSLATGTRQLFWEEFCPSMKTCAAVPRRKHRVFAGGSLLWISPIPDGMDFRKA